MACYHGLEAGVQLREEGWFPRQSQDSLLNHGALHVIVLDHHVLLQDFDGVKFVGAFPLCQHHLKGIDRWIPVGVPTHWFYFRPLNLVCVTLPKLPFPKTMMKLKSESLTRSWLPLLSYLHTEEEEEDESAGFPGPTLARWVEKKQGQFWQSTRKTNKIRPAAHLREHTSNFCRSSSFPSSPSGWTGTLKYSPSSWDNSLYLQCRRKIDQC